MGWANCGEDSQGRPIGYAHEATCDHPECTERIDRGLSYVCGNMHGEDEFSCEKYYCENHRTNYVEVDGDRVERVCDACAKLMRENECWRFDEVEGMFVDADKPLSEDEVEFLSE